MNQNVFVSIKGVQMALNDDSPIEVISHGKFYKRNGKSYIKYQEVDDENVAIDCMIKYSDDYVEINRRRQGVVTCLMFERDKSCTSNYNTPFGNIIVSLITKEMDITEEDNKVVIDIKYAMEFNYSFVSDCFVEIRVAENYNDL